MVASVRRERAMASSVDLADPIFDGEADARGWLEGDRWTGKSACAHCGSLDVRRRNAAKGADGKRLTYRRTDARQDA